APLRALPGVVSLAGKPGQAVSSAALFSFEDSLQSPQQGVFRVTIDWGDGGAPPEVGPGELGFPGGGWSGPGSHAYSQAGDYEISVFVKARAFTAQGQEGFNATLLGVARAVVAAPLAGSVPMPAAGELVTYQRRDDVDQAAWQPAGLGEAS